MQRLTAKIVDDAPCLVRQPVRLGFEGRTHQIRVHMAHIGHPLIGDPEYGAAFKTKANRLPDEARRIVNDFRRQALHAYLLQFEHPTSGEVMHFEAPLPADMAALLEALRDMPS